MSSNVKRVTFNESLNRYKCQNVTLGIRGQTFFYCSQTVKPMVQIIHHEYHYLGF